jgi:hypothetical protein
MSTESWTKCARAAARTAHEEFFENRWGTWVVEETPDVLVVYSNHFYKDFPARQAEEIEELTRRFSGAGIGVLGHATYPTSGPDDGYSYAMVLRAGEPEEPTVASIQGEVIELMLARCGEGA